MDNATCLFINQMIRNGAHLDRITPRAVMFCLEVSDGRKLRKIFKGVTLAEITSSRFYPTDFADTAVEIMRSCLKETRCGDSND